MTYDTQLEIATQTATYETWCRYMADNFTTEEAMFDVPPTQKLLDVVDVIGLDRYEGFVQKLIRDNARRTKTPRLPLA